MIIPVLDTYLVLVHSCFQQLERGTGDESLGNNTQSFVHENAPEHPYKKYESHPYWKRIDKGISDLVENQDLVERGARPGFHEATVHRPVGRLRLVTAQSRRRLLNGHSSLAQRQTVASFSAPRVNRGSSLVVINSVHNLEASDVA